MFTPLPTPREMGRWDQAAIELGLPEMLLMENASREALHVLQETCAPLKGKRVLFFMGGGNNGGDAACLARHVMDAGARVLVLHSRPLAAYKGVTGQHMRLARRCGVSFALAASWPVRFQHVPQNQWLHPDVVVDGLLGTGFSGMLRPQELDLVHSINLLGKRAFVLALDIPSGLSGRTGQACPLAVQATATVTFEAAKPGLVLPEAAPYTGVLHVRPIGIPALVRKQYPASFRLIEPHVVRAVPVANPHWHKGRAGHVLVVGGSAGLTGAPYLSACGAMRAGAGLVTATAPAGLMQDIKAGDPTIMTRPLRCGVPVAGCVPALDAASALVAATVLDAGPVVNGGASQNTQWSSTCMEQLAPLARACNAVVLGPGLGRSQGAGEVAAAFLALPDRPSVVVDADALYALAANPSMLKHLRPGDVLTPHPGEAAMLLHSTGADIQADRFTAIAGLMALAPAVWVLKGAGTLVGRGGESVALCPWAVPHLAVGGSGDVLAGVLGAFLAQGTEPFLAACAAVLVHAQAGKNLATTFPFRGNTALDIAAAVPMARAVLSA